MNEKVLQFTDWHTGSPILVKRQGTELVSAVPVHSGATALKLNVDGVSTLYDIKEPTPEILKIFEERSATAPAIVGSAAAVTFEKKAALGPVAPPGEALDIDEILKNPG